MGIVDKKSGPRAAIKEEPLRLPGESLRKEFNDQLLDGWIGPAVMLLIIGAAVVAEWVRYLLGWMPTFPTAISFTLVGGAYAVFFLYRMRRADRDMARLKQGMVGEVYVGQFLDNVCRGMGYRVLHDVPGEGFNVDHVLIGPGGVFSLETKNWTKPEEWAVLEYDGETVCKPGGVPDRKPVEQAKACADFVRKLIEKRTGRVVAVRAVLLVPGWWVEGKSTGKEVWVLGTEGLRAFLAREGRKLKGEEVALCYEALATYGRGAGR